MTTLSPQAVLVTGSNRGLGLEFVKQFLQLQRPPKYVFAGCRTPTQATELQSLASVNPSVRIVKIDLQDDASISAAAAEVETVVGDAGLNLLLNNAGISDRYEGIAVLTRERLNNHFDVNVSGPMMVTKSFLPLLQKAAAEGDPDTLNCNRAAVINVSSNMGVISEVHKQKKLFYPYFSAKCALNMATATLSNEVSPDGILAAVLHPGWVKTDMGGPNAKLEIPDAVSQCMRTLSSLDRSSSGKFITYAGECMSWSNVQ